jgi:hypothetical protein
MNALYTEGFVLFGGPLEGTQDVMLIVRADNETESDHFWTCKDLLQITQPAPWTLRLGSLGRRLVSDPYGNGDETCT